MDFELWGLKIHLDITFFAVLGIFLYLGVSSNLWWMLSALLLHETGHLLAALITGIKMKVLSFSCFGIRLVRESGIMISPKRELLVYLGGPVMNLCCFLLLWCLGKEVLCIIHLLLGLFQLLPIGALDGGCMLRLLLQQCVSPEKTDGVEILVSGLALLPLFWLGIRLVQTEKHNFTLLICCVFLLLTILKEKF